MSDNNSDRFSLSRRKALAGLGGIGTATALGGLGTYAQFTDSESETISFTAGRIDGTVRAGASYNGNGIQNIDGSDVEVENLEHVETDDSTSGALGLNIELTDVKPGDYGCFAFEIEVQNNPAWVGANIGYDNSTNGGFDADDADPSGTGTIQDNMLVIPFYKGDEYPSEKWDPCVFFDEENEEYHVEDYKGSSVVGTTSEFWSNSEDGLTPATLKDASNFQAIDTHAWDGSGVSEEYNMSDTIAVGPGTVFLNGDGPSNANQQGAAPLQPGDKIYFGWDWHIPFDTGNEMQGDTMDLQLGFVFGQTRHTESAELSNVFAPGKNTPNN